MIKLIIPAAILLALLLAALHTLNMIARVFPTIFKYVIKIAVVFFVIISCCFFSPLLIPLALYFVVVNVKKCKNKRG